MTMEEMNEKSLSSYVYVEADNLEKMKKALEERQVVIKRKDDGFEVRNLEAKEIGRLALEEQLILHELKSVKPSLEELFTEITSGKADYVSQGTEDK